MAQKKETKNRKKSQKPRARVKDLTPSKERAGKIRGGKVSGSKKYTNIVLKRGAD
jgi:hypothetical protein